MPRSLSRSARSTRDEEFSAFVQDHRPQFLRAAILLTAGDTHAGEDLVQTALARAYVAWPRLRERPVAYVHRVVVNTYIDETRRPWWRHERSVPDPPEPARLALAGFAAAEAATDGEAVRTALALLPPRMRAAVVLRHWLDLSVEESADLLGCSPGTVKSQTAKGVAKLRELLAGIDPETASTLPSPL